MTRRGVAFLLGAALACAAPLWGAGVWAPAPSVRSNEEQALLAPGLDLRSTAAPAVEQSMRALLAAAAKASDLDAVTIDYPLDASIFPPEILAPTFLWHDASEEADAWVAEIAFRGPERVYALLDGPPPPEGPLDPLAMSATNAPYEPTAYQASSRSWRPSTPAWETIKRLSRETPATVTLLGFRKAEPSRPLSRGRVTIRTSADPVGAPIFYRDVPLSPAQTQEGRIAPLPKGALPIIAWRLKDVSRPDSRVLLTSMPTCANCHSFSADGKTLALDIDGPSGDKGSYGIVPIQKDVVVRPEHVMTWNSFSAKPPGHRTLGFLSRISPDGRNVLSTVNELIYVVNFEEYGFGQVFYPTRGILAWYSRETGEIRALPGADDPRYVHCNPVWSPDGKTIVFGRAEAKDPYPPGRPLATYAGDPNETPMQYDLYRMPFADGRGGIPEPIRGASANGMSNTFPKISPDGKWVVFTQCKNGQLMRPDGKLWIVPLAGGEPRLMRCNTDRMNSWHSFSPSGRWMVFSSKTNTPYTQFFLTHIDERGNDSPPILVEGTTAANRAVNIPEFVNVAYDDFASISVPAVEHYRHFNVANDLAIEGKLREAVAEYEKALDEEWEDSRIHTNMSKTLLGLGDSARALEHARESLRVNAFNYEMHANAGMILSERGEYDEAIAHLREATRLYPRYASGWFNLASVLLRKGDAAAAVTSYDEAIRRFPRYADAYAGRGMAKRVLGDGAGARADLDRVVELTPESPTGWYFRAVLRAEAGDLPGAREDADRALGLAGPPSPQRTEIERFLERIRETPR